MTPAWTSHMFLELRKRLATVGMVDADTFVLPLTQEQKAAALRLSVVHMNRTLKQMRRDGFIQTMHG
jgi:CRP-like cAMP-binding protein